MTTVPVVDDGKIDWRRSLPLESWYHGRRMSSYLRQVSLLSASKSEIPDRLLRRLQIGWQQRVVCRSRHDIHGGAHQDQYECRAAHGRQRRLLLRGQADEFLHAVCEAFIHHVAEIYVALGIHAEAVAPVEAAGGLLSGLGEREGPEFQRASIATQHTTLRTKSAARVRGVFQLRCMGRQRGWGDTSRTTRKPAWLRQSDGWMG